MLKLCPWHHRQHHYSHILGTEDKTSIILAESRELPPVHRVGKNWEGLKCTEVDNTIWIWKRKACILNVEGLDSLLSRVVKFSVTLFKSHRQWLYMDATLFIQSWSSQRRGWTTKINNNRILLWKLSNFTMNSSGAWCPPSWKYQ